MQMRNEVRKDRHLPGEQHANGQIENLPHGYLLVELECFGVLMGRPTVPEGA